MFVHGGDDNVFYGDLWSYSWLANSQLVDPAHPTWHRMAPGLSTRPCGTQSGHAPHRGQAPWAALGNDLAPGRRQTSTSFVWDTTTGVALLFGGNLQSPPASNDLWQYTYQTNTWTELFPGQLFWVPRPRSWRTTKEQTAHVAGGFD
ncbi:unnamed protein product [Symbiodinium natans]|uniref:Uncharacterized protein n=1 Tax=Symbiodinium natans TaxID=878477 RepID=A0A812IPU6_9DINO|nr:unnamed protein product [Symbiodinium natans]